MVRDEGKRVEEEVMARVFVLDAMKERDEMVRDFEPAGSVYILDDMVNVVEDVDEVLK